MRVENKRTYRGPGKYIGRPSKWGNPYVVPRFGDMTSRLLSIQAFEVYADARLKREPRWLDELRGAEALICWCAPLACHGDILVRMIAKLDSQPAGR